MSARNSRRRTSHPRASLSSEVVQNRTFGVLRWVVIAGLILLTVFPFLYMALLSVRDLSSVIQHPGDLIPSSEELNLRTYEIVLKPELLSEVYEGKLRIFADLAPK